MKHPSKREKKRSDDLTGEIIHQEMRKIFPKKNDYGSASFAELVPELAKFSILTRGRFKAFMTHHRRELLAIDRSPLSAREQRWRYADCGETFVRDATRRQFWFALPALVRTATELKFGQAAEVFDQSTD